MKVREVIKLLEENGWYQVKGGKGSHRKFKHADFTNTIIVPGNLGDDMPIGTLNNILKAAGLK